MTDRDRELRRQAEAQCERIRGWWLAEGARADEAMALLRELLPLAFRREYIRRADWYVPADRCEFCQRRLEMGTRGGHRGRCPVGAAESFLAKHAGTCETAGEENDDG